MAITTVVNVGELIESTNNFTVNGGGSAVTALSDSNAGSAVVIQPGSTVTLRFRLRAADVAALPALDITSVRTDYAVSYQPSTRVVFGRTTTDSSRVPFLGVSLESVVMSDARGVGNGSWQGPEKTEIDKETLQYGILTVTLDASRNEFPVSISTFRLVATTNELPVVTPGAVLSNGDRPIVTFGFRDPEGKPLEALRAWLFTETQAEAAGFNPNTAEPVEYSGTVYTSLPQYAPLRPIEPNTSYRMYFAASEEGANGRFTTITAAGPYVPIRVTVDQPPIPVLTAVRKSKPGRVALGVRALFNRLERDGARFYRSFFVAQGSDPTFYDNVPRASSLSRSRLILTAGNAGVTVEINSGSVLKVTAGEMISASYRAYMLGGGTVSADAKLRMEFRNSSNAVVSTVNGPTVRLSNFTTTIYAAAITVPPGAIRLQLYADVAAPNGQQVAFESAQLVPGPSLNLVAQPLIDKNDINGSTQERDHWLQRTISASGTVSAGQAGQVAFVNPLVVGDRSSEWTIGATNGNRIGPAQPLTLPAGQSMAFVAVVRLNKAGTVRMSHHQLPSPITTTVDANEPTLIGGIVTTGAQKTGTGMLSAEMPLCITTDVANSKLTVGLVMVYPAPAGTDIAGALYPDDWTAGAMVTAIDTVPPFFRVERSDDNGLTWEPVRGVSSKAVRESSSYYSSNVLTFDDLTAPGDIVPLYRARSVRTINSLRVPSPVSVETVTDGSDAGADDMAYLVSLSDLANPLPLHITFDIDTERDKFAAVKQPLEGLPITQFGGMGGISGSLNLDIRGKAERDALEAMDALPEVLLLKMPDDDPKYVTLPQNLKLTRKSDTAWETSLAYVESEPPDDEE